MFGGGGERKTQILREGRKGERKRREKGEREGAKREESSEGLSTLSYL